MGGSKTRTRWYLRQRSAALGLPLAVELLVGIGTVGGSGVHVESSVKDAHVRLELIQCICGKGLAIDELVSLLFLSLINLLVVNLFFVELLSSLKG